MLFIFYILVFVFGVLCFYLANKNESFPLAYLGMFMFLLIGIIGLYEGVEMQTGSVTNSTITGNLTTDVLEYQYTTYTPANNLFVNALANIFFYAPIVGIIATTFFAVKTMD